MGQLLPDIHECKHVWAHAGLVMNVELEAMISHVRMKQLGNQNRDSRQNLNKNRLLW